MNMTKNFRWQHSELLQIAGEVSYLLETLQKDGSPTQIMDLMAVFAGKLQIHLALEDKSLYPHLLTSENTRIAELSTEFLTEMGSLSQTFTVYKNKWVSIEVIQADLPSFIKETRDIFGALSDRIILENTVLYPAIEKL